MGSRLELRIGENISYGVEYWHARHRDMLDISGLSQASATFFIYTEIGHNRGGRFPFPLTLPNHRGGKREKLPPDITLAFSGICLV